MHIDLFWELILGLFVYSPATPEELNSAQHCGQCDDRSDG